jgi:hypothetical protein
MENIALKSDMTSQQLSSEILSTPEFCRDEESIETSDLISYLFNGIGFYMITDGKLSGVITFDINVDYINIYGLCAPGPSVGAGSQLINAVKKFAQLNGIKTIKLTCYGSVVDFYTKNGFIVASQSAYRSDDSDDDDSDDESETKMRYNMVYNVTAGGRKKKTRRNKKNTKTGRRKNKKPTKTAKKYYR